MAHDHIEGVRGFRVAGVHCGLKKAGRLDLALIVSDTPCTAAGVFTVNQVKAAPVLVGMERLDADAENVRALVINTGSANAMTGERGLHDAIETTRITGDALNIDPAGVLPLSTGVIGLPLPMDKIAAGIAAAAGSLGDDWRSAADAITTTDTRPKLASRTIPTMAGEYTIAGIAKGAGMIAPNMATMLALIVTDAKLTRPHADSALKDATGRTFNRIVVDGDMSTNDTVYLLANGQSGVAPDAISFQLALDAVCRDLAQAIVRDGEGVTKFISICVRGAANSADAHRVANTIATSPLVKTAFYGHDANWGRIVAAAGRAGVAVDPARFRLCIAEGVDAFDGGLTLLDGGAPTGYAEADASAIMHAQEISIMLDLGGGGGSALVWTTDLSHDYVSINADYRS